MRNFLATFMNETHRPRAYAGGLGAALVCAAIGCHGAASSPQSSGDAVTVVPLLAAAPEVQTDGAQEPAGHVAEPVAFVANGRPIHPQCIALLVMGGGQEVVPPTGCAEQASGKRDAATGLKGVTLHGTMLHYEFTSEHEMVYPAFIEYEPLVRHGKNVIIRYRWRDGNALFFSGIAAVAHHRGELRLKKHIAGGSVCEGGVQDVTVTSGMVTFTRRLTAAILLKHTPETPLLHEERPFWAYDRSELCVATTVERYDAAKQQHTLRAVNFERDLADSGLHEHAFVGRGGVPPNTCFLQMFQDHAGQRLTLAQLDKFVRAFQDRCVEPAQIP